MFTQSIGVESVQGDLLVIGAGASAWTRVEEHQEIRIEDSATCEIDIYGVRCVLPKFRFIRREWNAGTTWVK